MTNTGNVPLTGVAVTDSDGASAVTCPGGALAPGRGRLHGDRHRDAGQYANTGTVTAGDPRGPRLSETRDPSHYFGVVPGIDIEKATNGADADAPPGPFIPVGDAVNWTYVVTNTGNVALPASP